MYSKNNKSPWYGTLKTSRMDTIVIYDPELPEAPPGKVFLFNAQRGDFVQYVEEIVTKNLHELDDKAMQQAREKYKDAFKKASKQLKRQHKDYQVGSAPLPKANKPVSDEVDDDSDIDLEPTDFSYDD